MRWWSSMTRILVLPLLASLRASRFESIIRNKFSYFLKTSSYSFIMNVPSQPYTIARPRLLSKLQQAYDHQLTLISAPPGYGKTIVAGQFAAQAPVPVAWHTLERRDRDLPTLYRQ